MTLISIPPNGTISYRKDIKYGVSSRLTVQAESLTFAEVMVFKLVQTADENCRFLNRNL